MIDIAVQPAVRCGGFDLVQVRDEGPVSVVLARQAICQNPLGYILDLEIAPAGLPAISFHHAVRLRMTWRNEAVLDPGSFAQNVEDMLANGYPFTFDLLLAAGKTVCKLTAVIGARPPDLIEGQVR